MEGLGGVFGGRCGAFLVGVVVLIFLFSGVIEEGRGMEGKEEWGRGGDHA